MRTPMTVERLSASLADRYRLERELGQGGMASYLHVVPRWVDRMKRVETVSPSSWTATSGSSIWGPIRGRV